MLTLERFGIKHKCQKIYLFEKTYHSFLAVKTDNSLFGITVFQVHGLFVKIED